MIQYIMVFIILAVAIVLIAGLSMVWVNKNAPASQVSQHSTPTPSKSGMRPVFAMAASLAIIGLILVGKGGYDVARYQGLKERGIATTAVISKRIAKSRGTVRGGTRRLHDSFYFITNCRIRFENGAVCNLTASRIARDRLRKIRVFQENVYITLDYFRQEALIMTKNGDKTEYRTMEINKSEPLREELQDFIECVQTKQRPVVSGTEGRAALAVALQIVSQISQPHPIHV